MTVTDAEFAALEKRVKALEMAFVAQKPEAAPQGENGEQYPPPGSPTPAKRAVRQHDIVEVLCTNGNSVTGWHLGTAVGFMGGVQVKLPDETLVTIGDIHKWRWPELSRLAFLQHENLRTDLTLAHKAAHDFRCALNSAGGFGPENTNEATCVERVRQLRGTALLYEAVRQSIAKLAEDLALP